MKVLKRHVRMLAFVLLAAITVYGFSKLFTGDWPHAVAYWKSKGPTLCAVFLLQTSDIFLDSILWMWILSHFNIRVPFGRAQLIFLAGYAGLLMPAQLGRLIRADALTRMGLGTLGSAVKAEMILLVMSAVGALALLSGLMAYTLHPLLMPLTVIVVITAVLLVADRLVALVPGIHVRLPAKYWRQPHVFLIALLAMVGWAINGTSLYLVVHDLPGHVGFLQALFVAPSNLLLAVGTGLPGGIGAVEAFLGVSLTLLNVPAAHLALAIGAFRLATFWVWIPIGWAAFTWLQHRIKFLRSRNPE